MNIINGNETNKIFLCNELFINSEFTSDKTMHNKPITKITILCKKNFGFLSLLKIKIEAIIPTTIK